jgi:hypothetical protein
LAKNPFTRQQFRGNRTRREKKFQAPTPDNNRIPTGPRYIYADTSNPLHSSGPGPPPPGFIGGTNSVSEWYIYWALTKLLGPEGREWTYQSSYLGGRRMKGGAVVDFVVFTPRYNIGLRIQTFYFHLAAGSYKQASDLEQRVNLEHQDLRIIDIYEQDFIGDKTGQSAIRVVQMALNGNEAPNPRAYGIVREH